MTTRKNILTEKYIEFQAQITNEGIECFIFPSIEEVDLSNLVQIFESKFKNSNNYKDTIKELISKYSLIYSINLTDDELNKIFPFIEKFINTILKNLNFYKKYLIILFKIYY